MKEQEVHTKPYFDANNVYHSWEDIQREQEEAEKAKNQNPAQNENNDPNALDDDDIAPLNINEEVAKNNQTNQAGDNPQQNDQGGNPDGNAGPGEQPTVPQAQVKVSPEFIKAVKNLHEAYLKLDDGAKADPKKGIPMIEKELEDFKAVADKEAQTNNIIQPGWKNVFDSQLNQYGVKYIDFFVRDTAKKCGIANELDLKMPDPDMERMQRLQSEKERIQREMDALAAKMGKEAEANVENNLKGFKVNKKGQSEKEYLWNTDNATREKQIKQSQENGYKNQEDLKSQDTTAFKKQTRSLKYLGRELQKEYSLGKRPASIKRMNENLEVLDKVMKELSGRTRLTADELEAFDIAATNAYKATQKFQKDTKDKIAGRKKIKGNDGKEREDIRDSEKVALAGTDKIQKEIAKLKEKVFEKELKAKVDEMKGKCEQESAKLDADRSKLVGKKNISTADHTELEENIARTLYYNNRMSDLGKQKKLSLEPGRTLGATMKRLENQIIPDGDTLDYIKNSPLCKELVSNAEAKLKKGEAFTNADVVAGQKSYEQRMGDNIRQQRMREQNMNPNRNNNRQLDQPTAGPTGPGMG